MKYLALSIWLLTSTASAAFDNTVAIGQWAAYQSNMLSADYYYFLNINSDFSGKLVRHFGGQSISREFQSSDVKKHDGYFEVNLHPNEKAVFSAWKLKSGSGKLTGQILMFNSDGTLFNMMYFPLEHLSESHELLRHEAIDELSNAHR